MKPETVHYWIYCKRDRANRSLCDQKEALIKTKKWSEVSCTQCLDYQHRSVTAIPPGQSRYVYFPYFRGREEGVKEVTNEGKHTIYIGPST